jgi:hypothetical protein
MNEQTTKLLEALAAKLGTTAEYLWTVLLRQAWISAIEDVLQYLVVASLPYFMWKFHKRMKATMEGGYLSNDEEKWLIVGVCWFVVAVIVFWAFLCIPDTITKLVNPEYWALSEVLHALR